MSEPVTPQHQKRWLRPQRDVPGTPTPRRQQEMRETLLRLNEEDNGGVQAFVVRVRQAVEKYDRAGRTALKHTLFKHLSEIEDENTNPLDIFCTETLMDRVGKIIDHQDPDDTSDDEEEGNDGDDEGEETSDTDRVTSRPPRERAAREDEGIEPDRNDDDVIRADVPPTERGKLDKAFADLGWIQGDGILRSRPMIKGTCRQPKVIHPAMALSVDHNAVETAEKRSEFEQFLEDLRWKSNRPGEHVWARLHPWSIQFLGELFFHHFIGFGFLQHVQRLITTLLKENEDGISRAQGLQARHYVARHEDLPDSARVVLESFAQSVDVQSGSDLYTTYLKAKYEIKMISAYDEFSEAVKKGRHTAEYQFLEAHYERRLGPTRVGVGKSTYVKEFFYRVLGVDRVKFNSILNRIRHLMHFEHAYGSVILLLFGKGMVNSLNKVALDSLVPAIEKFNELVPEFGETLDTIRAKFTSQLEDGSEESLLRLATVGNQMSIGRRGRSTKNWQDLVYGALDIGCDEHDVAMGDAE